MENKTNAIIDKDEIEAESSAMAVPVEALGEVVLVEVELVELSAEVVLGKEFDELSLVKDFDEFGLEDFEELEDAKSVDDIVVDKELLVVMVVNPELLEVDPGLTSATLKIPL